jgi:hypothetical protein
MLLWQREGGQEEKGPQANAKEIPKTKVNEGRKMSLKLG